MSATELQTLRDWRDGASLTLSDLREEVERLRSALKVARPWLRMVASEQDRPETSHIHKVLSEVDAALGIPDVKGYVSDRVFNGIRFKRLNSVPHAPDE